MSKQTCTTHNFFKILGIKIWEYRSDYLWNDSESDSETLSDDIIIHENIIRKWNHENN